MARLRAWLRPPRSLLVVFLVVMLLPAATLIVLGVRLLEQDRALAAQRRLERLEHAVDRVVRALEQDLALLAKRLAGGPQGLADIPDGLVRVVLQAGRIEASPPGRLPYYPAGPSLKEPPAEHFAELESQEFREQDLNKALETSRRLAGSNNLLIRAGALLREARILRKMGRPDEALEAYQRLGAITAVAIQGMPADLAACRARCAVLEEQARKAQLFEEAAAIERGLRSGKWQLDRLSFLHVAAQLSRWLGREIRANAEDEALAGALEWLYQKSNGTAPDQLSSAGAHFQPPVTIVWIAAAGRVTALLAGPRYAQAHWLAGLQKLVSPARAYLLGAGEGPPAGVPRVQRTAADTGLPWTLALAGVEDPAELQARRRLLLAGLAALLVLIAAGGGFVWRSVNRELAVARLQSDFVSAVSHEFRTPLTSLRQFNELLQEEEGLPPEKRRTYYGAQARATERLRRLVESLLDFGRMEAGRRPYRFEPLDAGRLALDVAGEFRGEVSGLGFSVDRSVDSGNYPVEADSEALSRALWNLLDNAAKYSGDSRKIELRVERDGSAISIAVRDYGLGVPVPEQRRIFQKFVRGSAAKSLGVKGTGIGLAMVRHIVEAHGGSVRVTSAPGEGSTFTIELPAKA